MKKQFSFLRISLIACLFSFLIYGCFKKDFDKLVTPEWSPDVALPLIKSKVGVDDVLDKLDNDSLYVDVDDNFFVTLIYTGNVFSNKGEVVVKVPPQTFSQDVTVPALDIADFTVVDSVSLGTIANSLQEPERSQILDSHDSTASFPPVNPPQNIGSFEYGTTSSFTNATFSSGDLTMTVENRFPVDIINLVIEFVDNQSQNTVATFSFPPIPPGNTESQTESLAGQTISNDMSINIPSIGSNGSITPLLVDTGAQKLVLTLEGQNLEISGGSATFPYQDDPFLDTVPFSFDKGERLDHLILKEGMINYSSSNSFNNNLMIRLEILNAEHPTLGRFSEEFAVTDDVTFDLAGYEFDFTEAEVTPGDKKRGAIVAVNFSSNGQEISFSPGSTITADLTIEDVVITYVDGYLGQQVFNIREDTISLNVYKNVKSGNIFFENPQVEMTVRNSYGLPIDADFKTLTAVKKLGGKIDFQKPPVMDPLSFNYPEISDVGEFANTVVAMGHDPGGPEHSNIRDIIAASPIELIYALDVLSNTDPADSNKLNFVTDSSFFEVDVEVRLPLHGWVKEFVIEDTFDLDVGVMKSMDYANFLLTTINWFPIDVVLQLSFLDSNKVLLDSLLNPPKRILVSGDINADGRVITPAEEVTVAKFPEDRFKNIKDASKAIIRARFETKDAPVDQLVKIYSTYSLDVTLGVQAGLRIRLPGKNNEDEE